MNEHHCDFYSRYPAVYHQLEPGCQFKEETTLFGCSGKTYCRFHLPMTDENGKATTKTKWAQDEIATFNAGIDTIIEAAKISENLANLTGIVFPERAIFDETDLPETLWYDAHFSRGASYKGATFLATAGFVSATFSESVRFDGATFSDKALFMGTSFNGDAVFTNATFSHGAGFTDATFLDWARFERSKFLKDAVFFDAAFLVTASFNDATFLGNVNFSYSKEPTRGRQPIRDDLGAGLPDARGMLYNFDFSRTIVKGTAEFDNRKFEDAANFSGVVFEKPPKFHGATLHQGTKWRGTRFTDEKSEDAEQAYRTLRLAMENIRDRPQEAVFFAKEQRAMRHRAKWWELRKWLSLGYDWTSKYGRSPGRPLAWLLGSLLFFCWVYWLLAGQPCVDPILARDLAVFSVQQIIKPFTLWGRGGNDPLVMPAFTAIQPLTYKLIATLQSVFSLTFLTLFLLALRWQFRRG